MRTERAASFMLGSAGMPSTSSMGHPTVHTLGAEARFALRKDGAKYRGLYYRPA